ncbi:hypothetical protein [Klebsiella sp. BIGb0407]|uniref:hypothetical protein n=1 Tax=Klebsiella sp. BIGb0407 TaxID=2940603 RepID=UPI0021690900|nr:hypothetical protein [Klebsiella sp. BIGb0407]MCS3431612.1 hypothetical protein [Klebsiella sp. BIGb0407]
MLPDYGQVSKKQLIIFKKIQSDWFIFVYHYAFFVTGILAGVVSSSQNERIHARKSEGEVWLQQEIQAFLAGMPHIINLIYRCALRLA